MKDLNKFLDENNIIKREELFSDDVSTDFDVRTAQFLDVVEPKQELPKEEIQPQETPRKPKIVTKEKPKIKTRRDMINEMIEKTSYQLLSKEVDYEVYQIFEQKHCSTQKEREICDQNMKNIRKDAKLLERRLEVLNKFLQKEPKDG